MTRITQQLADKLTAPTLEYLQQNPGCYQVYQLHRALSPESNYTNFVALLNQMAKDKLIKKHKLNGALVAYSLPNFEGTPERRDAKYYARQKIQKFLPGQKPQDLFQICQQVSFAANTVRPVVKELVAQGAMQEIKTTAGTFYQWQGGKCA